MAHIILLAIGLLAFANGANDNFKGVATLFGSRTTNYKTAIGWATITTFSGSVAAIFLAQTLLRRFSGKGLVPDTIIGSEYFILAVAVGAGLTVIVATVTGFPISTTHALIGAMAGSGWVAVGTQVKLSTLGTVYFLPLLMSPMLAVGCGAILYLSFRWLRLKLGVTKEWCVCVGEAEQVVVMPQPASILTLESTATIPTMCMDESAQCSERYAGRFLGVTSQQIMDTAHFISAGIVSFARGLNDTPKIAALLLVLPGFNRSLSMGMIAIAIAAGGLLSARRVAETMSNKITVMNHGQGFSANLGTGLLVIGASLGGMPVSTTHVSVGSLFGIGLVTRQADYRVITNILLSWMITLPCAIIISALVYWVASA